MKALAYIFGILLFLFLPAQKTEAQRWPFGSANAISITPTNDTIVISSELKRGINYLTYSTDTATVVQCTNLSSELKLGDFVYFEISNTGADNETVTWSTGLTGSATTLTAVKTHIIVFIYNGTALKKFSQLQVN